MAMSSDHDIDGPGQSQAETSSAGAEIARAPAIFAIPTHATTHASVAGLGDSDDDDEDREEGGAASGTAQSSARVYGRPAPSPIPSAYHNSPRAYSAPMTFTLAQSQGPLPDPAAFYSPAPTMAAPAATWRTANTILHANPTAQHVSQNAWTGLGQQRHGDAQSRSNDDFSPAPAAAAAYQPMPPRYGRLKGPQGSGNDGSRSQPLQLREEQVRTQGRFPRWRGWLEKRAQERAAADGKRSGGARQRSWNKASDVERKKSWGAGVDGSDAVSELDDVESIPAHVLQHDVPLHLHSFGSRFIPHIPSLPLCSAIIELGVSASNAAARLLQRTVPESRKRRVLLVGTADGLYALEFRRDLSQESDDVDGKVPPFDSTRFENARRGAWNRNLRCVQVWSGVGVYQLSVLSPPPAQEVESKNPLHGIGNWAGASTEAGILLALCSTKMYHSKPVPSSSGLNFQDLANSSSGGAHRESSAPTLDAGRFGDDAGGGFGRPLPPGSSGGVRMWSLEALRRMVTHVLDSFSHEPLDLQKTARASGRLSTKFDLAQRIRRAWQTFGEGSAPASSAWAAAKVSSSNSKRQSAMLREPDPPMQLTQSAEGLGKVDLKSDRAAHGRSRSEDLMHSNGVSDDIREVQLSDDEPSRDAERHELQRLAQSWVPITLPGYAQNHGHNDSMSSLFSEEGGTAMAQSTPTLPNPVFGPPSSNGKGVLFYALTQAQADATHPGNWYLVLAQSKSLLLFESLRPAAKGAARSWNFLKELYTPMQPRGISFCFSASSDPEDYERRTSSTHSSGITRNASVKKGSGFGIHHAAVRSSPYSSVFRDESSLHLFVSFGAKAVLIRASDGNVREVMSPPDSAFSVQNMWDKDHHYPDTASHAPKSSHGHNHSSAHSMSSHRRSLTAEALEASCANEIWNGFQTAKAEVRIRCLPHPSASDGNTARLEPSNEDDEEDWESDDGYQPNTRAFALRDTSTAALSRHSLLHRNRTHHSPGHLVVASVALISRGKESYIVPSPLPREAPASRCLGILVWSAIPTSTTVFARVVGLERGLSSGPVPVDVLGQNKGRHSSMLDPSVGNIDKPLPSPRQDKKTSSDVILHIDVAVLAFLPSRLELKEERVRLPVKLPFSYARDSELDLEPAQSASAPNTLAAPNRSSSMTSALHVKAGDAHVESVTQEGNVDEDGQSDEVPQGIHAEQELEYLCGMLHAVPQDGPALRPWEAYGDGGAWAFDFRGGKDYRVFYVGAHV